MFFQLLKPVLACSLILGATLALALPAPKDIEAAVNSGHYTQAESMLHEVLEDKPQSAKAHYELGQVLAHESRFKEAHTELEKAKDLDPSLKFASSPEKFNSVFTKVSELAVAPTSSVVMAPSQESGTHAVAQVVHEPISSNSGFTLSYVWLAIAGLVVLGLWLRRSAPVNSNSQNYAPDPMPSSSAPIQRGFGAQFTPNPTPGPYAPQGYPPQGYAQSTGGSTVTGAVVGGLAGVAAGYALSKALESEHHVSSTSVGSTPVDNGGYVPFDAPAQPDLGVFDAGSGSDWDNADSGSSSDDSW